MRHKVGGYRIVFAALGEFAELAQRSQDVAKVGRVALAGHIL